MQTTTSTGAQPAIESSLEATLRRFNDAFNRFDAKQVASFWAEDGTLLNPVGNYGSGRAEVERVYHEDAETILNGSTSRFTITSARPVGTDSVLLDCDHHVQNFRRPDGTRGDVTLHLVLLARRSGDGWEWVDARPYLIMERPQRLH